MEVFKRQGAICEGSGKELAIVRWPTSIANTLLQATPAVSLVTPKILHYSHHLRNKA
jgi:hypothetical protein